MRIISFFILFLCSISVFCQNPKIDKAKKLIDSGKSEKAINLLKKLYNKSEDVEAVIVLIDIYSNTNQNANAILWADKINLNESKNEQDVLRYAKLLYKHNQYQKALDHCLQFALNNKPNAALKELSYAAERLIKASNKAYQYTIEKLPFNTEYDEISISNYRNNHVMSSNAVGLYSKNTSTTNFDFYMLQQDFNQWRYPWPLLKNSDTKSNKTTLCYTYNGNEVYYTIYPKSSINIKSKTVEPSPEFKIRHAISLGNEWVEDSLLDFQKENYSYKDPAIHPNQKILVFSSNLNGNGTFDLFYCLKENGKWSEPQSLGEHVNTSFDETMPYFKQDGTLYFSSNNPYGFGGFDIYKTKLDGKIWIKPEILPPPINTKYDELSISFNYDLPGGFFVSNRIGGEGGYDIYKFKEYSLSLSVNVVDDNFGSLLSYAEIQLLNNGNIVDEKLTNEKGEVFFSVAPNTNYTLKVKKEGFETKSKSITTKNEKSGTTVYENFRIKKNLETEILPLVNHQNYITFTATFLNSDKQILDLYPIKIVNVTQGKIKFLNTNTEGKIEQLLYIGNNYEFEVIYNNQTITKTFSTVNLSNGEKKEVVFIMQNTSK